MVSGKALFSYSDDPVERLASMENAIGLFNIGFIDEIRSFDQGLFGKGKVPRIQFPPKGSSESNYKEAIERVANTVQVMVRGLHIRLGRRYEENIFDRGLYVTPIYAISLEGVFN